MRFAQADTSSRISCSLKTHNMSNTPQVIRRPANLPGKLGYISGPISGDPRKPREVNYANAVRKANAVSRIKGDLVRAGWTIYNPFDSVFALDNWDIGQAWIDADLVWIWLIGLALKTGQIERGANFLSNGWRESVGSKQERAYSLQCGLEIIEIGDDDAWKDKL